ncbi:MAG: hypothetical protein ABEH61_05190 [Haloarculaceae archaeon]
MGHPEYHRRRVAAWSRALLAIPLVAVLLGEHLVGTRVGSPDRFWGALVVVAFFAGWALLAAGWHYSILRTVRRE